MDGFLEIPIMTLYEIILNGGLSVFDIPFETRIRDTGLYSIELRRVRHDRKELDTFLKQLKEDMENLRMQREKIFRKSSLLIFLGDITNFSRKLRASMQRSRKKNYRYLIFLFILG